MPGMYYIDIEHLNEYKDACEDTTGEALRQYYDEYIFGVDSFEEYLEDLEFLKVKPGGASK